MAPPFPHSPNFAGYEAPCRFEGEAFELVVHGEIPKGISGTFYRVMPDPQVRPMFDRDIFFNGDGAVSAFRLHDGHADFKQRWVRTERFLIERLERRALFGLYRNRYTDHPSVKDLIHSTANTNIIWYDGRLLALKEDSPPYAMDPDSLETIGVETFKGQIGEKTPFTAHPKFHPTEKTMMAFGYEAKGDGSKDMVYYVFDHKGNKLEEVWLESPWAGMIHDWGLTENWVVFQLMPLVCDVERLKKGGLHFQWDNGKPFCFGCLPRRGAKGSDVKWFKHKNAFPGHVSNAYEDEQGKIVLDCAVTDGNVFGFFPDDQGAAPDPRTLASAFYRFHWDPKSDDLQLPQPKELAAIHGEFPRCDERFAMGKYRHSFICVMDHTKPFDVARVGGPPGPIFNSIVHLDTETGKMQNFFAGPTSGCQEPVFIPRDKNAEEGDGYLLLLVNRLDTMLSDLVILDTKAIDFGTPVATINLPVRLRTGFHGNWVDATDMELPELCDWPKSSAIHPAKA